MATPRMGRTGAGGLFIFDEVKYISVGRDGRDVAIFPGHRRRNPRPGPDIDHRLARYGAIAR
jgi:hypothetical protein